MRLIGPIVQAEESDGLIRITVRVGRERYMCQAPTADFQASGLKAGDEAVVEMDANGITRWIDPDHKR
jgi:hypothetical protein